MYIFKTCLNHVLTSRFCPNFAFLDAFIIKKIANFLKELCSKIHF